MQACLLGISIAVSLIALAYARYEYRKREILSLFGLFLLCAMLFVPNLIFHYAASYALPTKPLGYAGGVICVFGAALLVVATSLHLLVLIEEKHLQRVFGNPYEEFCRTVPRYVG